MRILHALILIFLARPTLAADWNPAILAATREISAGGGYAATSAAGARLRDSVRFDGSFLHVRPSIARPSYCSGATYLAFLKVIERAQTDGRLRLAPGTLAALPPAMQRDGQGVWGRWNANGPGTARLFYELSLGRNFVDWREARPGDFLKIFWRDAVGARERGHSVVYLGTEFRGGVEWVRYWSSNQPEGIGEKSVAKSKIVRAIFSRLEFPERLGNVRALPSVDNYLEGLLERESSFAQACSKSGIRN